MPQQKYPIGIQTFETIIEGGYAYVDKTAFVDKLVNGGTYYFLCRPRRFGKSLLLSTLQAYFEGKRELFKGLSLDSADVDWTPTPVLRFDLNEGSYQEENGLEEYLSEALLGYEQAYGIAESSRGLNPNSRFKRLINAAYQQTGRKVAILIDEYDQPLLELKEGSELFEKNRETLRRFFGLLKSMDACIRFAMLTGVARVSKVTIFSGLNNLEDISLSEEYANICGWTEEELVNTFRPGIEELADKRQMDFASTLEALRVYYDGYLFQENGSRLYNPFSVLRALKSREIEPYWFETGTPTFLATLVKENGILLPDLNSEYIDRQGLMAVGLNPDNLIPLMFQTGYLTIDSCSEGIYKLRFPNREVELGFAKQLYPMYVPGANKSFSFVMFRNDLTSGRPEDFMARLQTLVKDMPYDLQNENNYQSILWLLGTICGADTQAERHSYLGRSDLEITTAGYVYVFEFKLNQSVEEAMDQLRSRDYAGRYALDSRPVYIIGANFSTDKAAPGLTGWQIDRLK